MAKANILNSLSNNLAHSYFSTLNHYDQGYLCDWVVNSTKEISIDRMEIDIMNRQILPKELEIRPFLVYLDGLNNIIQKALKSNKLPDNFIVEAKFIINIDHNNRIIKCDGYTKGINGKIYSSKPYYEKSFETFTALNPSITQNINKKAKSFIGRLRFYLWRKFNLGSLKYSKRLEN